MANNLSENKDPLNYSYISNSTRTSLVVYLFWIFIILASVVSIIGVYISIKYKFAIYEQSDTAKEVFLQIVHTYFIASIMKSISCILSGIAFLFFIYRASANTHALNPQTTIEYSPDSCVGCYFLPFFNLYWPYKCMKELFILNVNNNETSSVLDWWMTYILFQLLNPAVSILTFNHSIKLNTYISLGIVSNIFGITSAIIAIRIITIINNAQINKAMTVNKNKTWQSEIKTAEVSITS